MFYVAYAHIWQIAGLLASFDEVCLPKQIGYFLVSEDVDDTLRVLLLSQFDQLHNSGKKVINCISY